jgi:hypothetical protein
MYQASQTMDLSINKILMKKSTESAPSTIPFFSPPILLESHGETEEESAEERFMEEER